MIAPNKEEAAKIVALRNRMYAARDKLDLARAAIKRAEGRRDILAAHERNTTVAERRIAVLKMTETETMEAFEKAVSLLCKAEGPYRAASEGKYGPDIYKFKKW